jgi:hypothetical protein
MGMSKKSFGTLILVLITMNQTVYADAIFSILSTLKEMALTQAGIAHSNESLLRSSVDIESLMKDVNRNLTGSSGWGTFQSHDYQSYGNSARSWSDVMRLADGGGGSGSLGQTVNSIATQFPIDKTSFNSGISDPSSQTYYAVQSKTVLATRAASQLDYDKVQDQIGYQQMLQQQIEKTKDLKSAVDLNNRIQVEANLINLEMLRQSALSNQQHAISEQANINSALSNAKFLTKQ